MSAVISSPLRIVIRRPKTNVSYAESLSPEVSLSEESKPDSEEEEIPIDRFIGYRGDAYDRFNMEFLLRYDDESKTELWHVYTEELASTVQFENYVLRSPPLAPLLLSPEEALVRRASLNKTKITEVSSGESVFVDLRCYGSGWYNSLNLPNADTKTYVARYKYSSKSGNKINVHVPIFRAQFAVDHNFVCLWGSIRNFDAESMILVDSSLIRRYPCIAEG